MTCPIFDGFFSSHFRETHQNKNNKIYDNDKDVLFHHFNNYLKDYDCHNDRLKIVHTYGDADIRPWTKMIALHDIGRFELKTLRQLSSGHDGSCRLRCKFCSITIMDDPIVPD